MPSSKKSSNKNSKNVSPKKNKLKKSRDARIVKKTQTHDTKAKNVVSAHGHITVRQRYKYCPHCARSYPFETELGNDNKYTKPLKCFAARCCGLGSYRVVEENLRELCGISLSYVTLNNLSLAVADAMREQQKNDPAQRERFQHATGETMFGADGTSVPTRNEDGTKQWREMKVGVFAKRVKGKRALPAD